MSRPRSAYPCQQCGYQRTSRNDHCAACQANQRLIDGGNRTCKSCGRACNVVEDRIMVLTEAYCEVCKTEYDTASTDRGSARSSTDTQDSGWSPSSSWNPSLRPWQWGTGKGGGGQEAYAGSVPKATEIFRAKEYPSGTFFQMFYVTVSAPRETTSDFRNYGSSSL